MRKDKSNEEEKWRIESFCRTAVCRLKGIGAPGGDVMITEKITQVRLYKSFSTLAYPLLFLF